MLENPEQDGFSIGHKA